MTKSRLFISYSHKDENDKIEMEKWLKPLIAQNWRTVFSDTDVIGGKELLEEIDSHLVEADIILLLLSQDDLTSKFLPERNGFCF